MSEAPFSFAFYRFSRVATISSRGDWFHLSLSATPGDYLRGSITFGRLGFSLSVGRRVTRENPGTERGYKHTGVGIDFGFGWVNRGE